MRKEPFTVDSYIHVVKRGARGLPIVRDDEDRNRFLLMLTHCNDTFSPENWFRDVQDIDAEHSFERPSHWPAQERLVEIVAFCLVENHFHLLLKEIINGGTSRFMQRLGTGMAKSFNERYKERGGLFQGPYRSKTITNDRYLRYVSAYIQVKNGFDMSPHGLIRSGRDFDRAFSWLLQYPYSSLGDYCGTFQRPIVQKAFLTELFTPTEYRAFCKDAILGRRSFDEEGLEEHQSRFFE